MNQQQNPYQPPSANTAPPPAAAMADPRAPTSRPGVVTAAAIIWIVFGSLGILGQLMTIAAGNTRGAFGILIAIAFLVVGIQSLTGKAKDTLGNGIGALVIGVLSLGVGTLFAGRGGAIILVVLLLQSGLMVTSGILALVGRSAYKAWRNSR